MNRFVLFLTVFASLVVFATAGANDGGYLGLRYQIDVSPGDDDGIGMRIQPDGKLFLAGTCYNPDGVFCATRLNPDATYDTTFGTLHLGYETIPVGSAVTTAFALTADGGAVIVGTNDGLNGPSYGVVARLRADGSLNTASGLGWVTLTFGSGVSYPSSSISAVALQPNGKIVLVGRVTRDETGNVDFGIIRLNSDLTVDSSFNGGNPQVVAFDLNGPSGADEDSAKAVVILSDGKILVAGVSDAPGNARQPTLARLLPDGTMDPSFGASGKKALTWGVYGVSTAMAVDRDGTVLLAGYGRATTTSSTDFVISRLSPDGTIDPKFGKGCILPGCPPGPVFLDFAYYSASYDFGEALTIQSDGKILIAGEAQRSDTGYFFAVARVDENGIPDPTFGSGGLAGGIIGPEPGYTDFLSSIAVGNGGIMISGKTYDIAEGKYRFSTGRLSLDLIFSNHFETRH